MKSTNRRQTQWNQEKPVPKGPYNRLIRDIAGLYEKAQRALVTSYWQIGKRIVQEEERAQGKAAYGAQLLPQLSRDLQQALGSGFSVRNLQNMRRFYLEHPNPQAPADLAWSQHVELMPVKDPTERSRLEQRIARQHLTTHQIRQAVRERTARNNTQRDVTPLEPTTPALKPQLSRTIGSLWGFATVARDRCARPRGTIVVDCGFNIWQTVRRGELTPHDTPSFTYPARVESVIDGDTLWVVVDCSRGLFTRQKLRLHRIDTPERGTPVGDKSRRFVTRVLKANPRIVVQTHKYDKYTRYLADIFYLPGSENPQVVVEKGIFLNQQLLDKGLARHWER